MFKILLICVYPFLMPGQARHRPTTTCSTSKRRGSPVTPPSSTRAIFYSQNPDAEMQKPSLGFDYIKRFSGESGDVATFALQARLALTWSIRQKVRQKYKLEPQIYNAYLKVKTPGPYVWVGHNRPAFGLSSYFDSHGLLLADPRHPGFRL